MQSKLVLKKTHDFSASKKPELTVVMIHGIASDSSTYNHALEYLEGTTSLKNIRFVTFDLLGSGNSPKSDELNYDYKEQVGALHNSIEKLKIKTPLVLVGHSLGTFIVTKYADTYKKSVKKLVLVSPPIYTLDDMKNPAFAIGIKAFEGAVAAKNPRILREKSFINSMEKIVLNKKNYKTLSELKTNTVLIYGDADQLIASYNVPKLLKDNPKYITAIKTIGRHGVTRDKYNKIREILEEVLHA